MQKQYSQYKRCNQCGYEDIRTISKLIAAFDASREWRDECPKCHSLAVKSSGCELPEIDEEIMLAWSEDNNLSFSQQDEDLMLAEYDYLNILLKYIDNENTLKNKKATLLSTLCVLVYDNTPKEDGDDSDTMSHIAEEVLIELKRRIDIFSSIDTIFISNYLKEIVYPQLGLPLTIEQE